MRVRALVVAHSYHSFMVFISVNTLDRTEFRYIDNGEVLYGYDGKRIPLIKLKGWGKGPCGNSVHIHRFTQQYNFDYDTSSKLEVKRWLSTCTSM